MPIELRSDTFTKPTAGMLDAMMSAPVGDDVFGEDPTINLLEEKLAGMFGMEAALFCPSGTMTNQIAIKVHTQPGDEVICDELSHVYQYEGGGIAFNSGCSVRLLKGDRGRITAEQVAQSINPDDPHKAATKLVVLENTSNRGGGACYNIEEIGRIREVCQQHGLILHLDGARIWNAMVAQNIAAKKFGEKFDSISVCLSKGLGTPVGSVLIGSKAHIKQARRIRKVFGGGMRQAGYLAAACVYALDNHIARLNEDHAHAKWIAEVLQQKSFVKSILPPETNIIIFETTADMPAKVLVDKLKQKDILCLATGMHHIRFVFHLQVVAEQIDFLSRQLKDI